MTFWMLRYTRRPSRMAYSMVVKLSSSRMTSAASLATSVPVMPMATPMSASLRAGESLTPSPVMAATSPVRLQRLDDAQLIRRGHAREHDAVFHRLVQLFVRHFVQLRAGNDGIALAENVQLLGDRHGGDLVVARDHDDADARRVAGLHRLDDLLAGRVDHADDADKGHVLFEVGRSRLRGPRTVAHGKAEHAQRLAAHACSTVRGCARGRRPSCRARPSLVRYLVQRGSISSTAPLV